MPTATIIQLDTTFTDSAGMPRSLNYATYFAAQLSLKGWFDFQDSDSVTLAGSKIASVAAQTGALSLAQVLDANRPTYANGRAVFSAADTQFLVGGGSFPSANVTVAAILRRAANATTTEGVIGSTSPGTGSHALFFQTNGKARFRVTNGVDASFEEPFAPVPPTGAEFLLLADFAAATGVARCRLDGGAGGANFSDGTAVTMNSTWFVGALSSAGASPANFEMSDLFVFDAPLVGTDLADAVLDYARDIKGV